MGKNKYYIYKTDFNLTKPVNSFTEVRDYFKNMNMIWILNYDNSIPLNIKMYIIRIDWIMKTKESGYIKLCTSHDLTDKQLSIISKWVYKVNENSSNNFEKIFGCQFNYQKNKYIFNLIKEPD